MLNLVLLATTLQQQVMTRLQDFGQQITVILFVSLLDIFRTLMYAFQSLFNILTLFQRVKFHPNSNYVVTGSNDKCVRLWDIHSGNCVRLFPGHFGTVYSLAVSPCGRFMASSGMFVFDDRFFFGLWILDRTSLNQTS